MAVIYLRSTDGSDSDDGSTWALAKATLANALTAAGAGGTVYVSHVHSESQASNMSFASPGTSASPVNVLCVNDGAEPPTTLATTAIAQTSVGSLTFSGCAYCYGVEFRAGTSSTPHINFNSLSAWWWRMERCKLVLRATSSSQVIVIGQPSGTEINQLLEFLDSDMHFAQSAQTIVVAGRLRWIGGTVGGAGTPSVFFGSVPIFAGIAHVEGVDFSPKNTELWQPQGMPQQFTFVNCKFHASTTLTTGVPDAQGGAVGTFINCSNTGDTHGYFQLKYQGTISNEIVIVRAGGASDGTTAFSRKMVTTANSWLYSPLEAQPIVFWNDTTGDSITLTVEVITDGVTLTDAEAWLEVEYLGTSGQPLSSRTNDRVTSVLATPVNQTSSSESWTTTGLSSPVKQSLAVTVTPQEAGLMSCYVCLARASTTMYFDPKVTVI